MTDPIKLPKRFLDRMETILGPEMPDFLASMEDKPIISLRRNPSKPADVFPDASPVPWCPTGVYLEERPKFVRDPLIHAGAYYVQEASSMLIYQCIDFTKDLKVLDLSAAPGGKSTLIGSFLSPGSLLVSNDPVRNRAAVLEDNLSRWGNPNVVVTYNRPSDFTSLKNFFDVILVDAPCSGEGMFRKDPDVIGHWTPKIVHHCAQRQKDILANVAGALKIGGRMIYSTCTYNAFEDEAVVEWILKESPGSFELLNLNLPETWGLTNGNAEQFLPELAHTQHCFPHKVKGEGFFMACLEKTGGLKGQLNKDGAISPRKEKRLKRGNNRQHRDSRSEQRAITKKVDTPNKSHIKEAQEYLNDPDQFFIEAVGENLWAYPTVHVEDMQFLRSQVQVLKAGVRLGRVSGNKFLPDHDLAMSTILAETIPRLELDYENAIQYLKRGNVQVDTQEMLGWVIATYKGHSLGWMKVLENRINIHLPKHWRIRADVSEWV